MTSASVGGFACVVATCAVLALGAAAGPAPTVSGSRPEARIPKDQAIALAVNDLEATPEGFSLRHPRHRASFTAQGLRFVPRRGGPSWQWRFEGRAVRPALDGSTILYRRGALTERYLPGAQSIEQQFVLSQRPAARGDLVIAGRIESAGALRRTPKGWTWTTKQGAVRLGDVTVFDAHGRKIPARMSVERDRTRIVVDGQALRGARYPVTVDPEIGANDFRISDMGSDPNFDAIHSAVAYNPTTNEYLVVWEGDDNTPSLVSGETEIFGQRVDATTGAEIAPNDFRISDMGPDGNGFFDAFEPAVAYNGIDNEYLVVWRGDDDTAPLVDNEFEVYGQRLAAATGAEVGTNDFRISDMGLIDGDPAFGALTPDVAYNGTDNEYLVVWSGDDDTPLLVANENEIFGQRLDAGTGAEILPNDFRISDMGPDGNAGFDALVPAVAHSGTEYLVVWEGDDNTAPLVANESEIFGQRVDAATGVEIAPNDFRISDMGPNGNVAFSALAPDVAYNGTNEYLVVWSGDDDAPLVDEEFEIFGQRLDVATGAEIAPNDFRISDMGPDANVGFSALSPSVAHNVTANEYLVVWHGDDDTLPLVDGENEIFGQRLDTAGAELGTDIRLSDMGSDGSVSFGAFIPAVAYNGTDKEYLVIWEGDDDTPPLGDDENEIFGQRLESATALEVGSNDFRISDMGSDANFDAFDPAVAYNGTDNHYLVVWQGDDDTPPQVNGELEIFGQRVNAATGAELAPNDFRISDMGTDGLPAFGAFEPAVAYNGTDKEYLVVWRGDDDTAPLVDGEFEIFGQRLSGATGAEVGANDFRISDMGTTDGIATFGAFVPAVVYNGTTNEYLVVWHGDDDTAPLVDGENEIFGQRLSAATGAELGANDLRISDVGPDGNVGFDALEPALAYNGSTEYLVVWSGEDNIAPLVANEIEILGQRLDVVTGAEVGANDFRISDMGPDGNVAFSALVPSVAYNGTNSEYLVVWQGDDDTPPLVDEEFEVYGQRLDAATGAEVGANDSRISDMGPDGNAAFDAFDPAVAYTGVDNEYLVAWRGDDDTVPLADDELEIFAQTLNAATGAEVGPNDSRISDMGPDGSISFSALVPAVAYSGTSNAFLVVWQGDDDIPPLGDDELEIFGQRFGPPPTAVVLLSFVAKRERGGVTLRWRTAQETQVLGFNVYREVAGKRVRVNRTLIGAVGGAGGHVYSYRDRSAPRGKTLRYRLQAVYPNGTRGWYGSRRV